MTQAKRISARAVFLAAGTAGFVALGAGVSGAETLTTPMHEVAPTVERALVEGVAPSVNSLAPEGVGPIANTALAELQDSAHNPDGAAPDLSAPLPEGRDLRTPLGTVPNPTSELADTIANTQDATGLDGNPHDTIGHDAGRALENGGHRAGEAVEETAVAVLPHTIRSVYGLREEVDLPRVDQVAPLTGASRLPDTAELPGASDLSSVTGGDVLSTEGAQAPTLQEVLGVGNPSTVRQSAATPTVPNVWDLAYAFGLETPGGVQDVMEATPMTEDNHVSLGEEEVLGMIGQRNLDGNITTVPQSAPDGLGDLTEALEQEDTRIAEVQPLNVDGPLADSGMPRLSGTGVPVVDDAVDATAPQLADAGLPRVAEGVDTRTAEDLVAELGRGTDLLNDVDTSDLVSVEGGTAPQETPEGMVQHPTFMDLPGSEALPVVS
ncbi:hypothetical protein [Nocardiopsis halotolerans]|uniref:hypothetical protein n=1 Tax=Nocardiopsis halotolerans TaxID=124252 RepID=UPI0003762204|nr:hypothetical protein [Nocardiopsis halotolerans]